MNLSKYKYQINEFEINKLEEFEKNLGEIKAEEYKWILLFMLNGEYEAFIDRILLSNLKDKSNTRPLIEQIEQLTLDYLKTKENKEIKDFEFKKNILDILKAYDLYMDYLDNYNYKMEM